MSAENTALVIGGRGFIGRHLVDKLVSAGCFVRIASRSAGSSATHPLIHEIQANVSDRRSLETAISGASEVFYLATGGGDRWSDFERDIIRGARNVAELCLENNVQRLYYASSIAALDLGRAGSLDESAGTDSNPLRRSHYSRAKAMAEAALLEMHQRSGLPVVIFRPGVVMGRSGPLTHSGLGYWPSDLCCIGWGRGNHPLPFVLADDVAEAFRLARHAPGIEGRCFNLVGDVRISAAEFVRILGARSLRRVQFFPRSLWQLQGIDIAKWLLKAAARKPDNVFPSFRDLKSRSLRTQIDCSTAKSTLGWKPVGDREVFLREAVDANLPAIPPGDLRLEK
jgi:nucleoside-diphosphate-sugar epimerase